jgi:hypothetical protein
MPPCDPGPGNVYQIDQPRHCATCVWRHPSRSAHGHPNGYYCDAPATKYRVAPEPVAELVTGEIDQGSVAQDFHQLFEHRSAGWLKARIRNLCGREGRWWKRDPKTLRPPNCGGSGVKGSR